MISKPLRLIATISSGQGAPQGKESYSNNGLPFIKAGNLEELLITGDEYKSCQLVSKEKAAELRLKIFPKGTIVFPKSGMSAKIGRVYQLQSDSYVVNHLATIIANDDLVNSKYIKYFFTQNSPSNLIKDSAYPSIRLEDISNIAFPIPSLDDQNRIVELLDLASSLCKKRKQVIDLLDEYLKSTFFEMFGDPLKNPKGFPIENIDFAIKEIKSGWSALGENRAANNDEFGVLKISSVTSGIFRSNENKFVASIGQKKLVTPQKGDLLFSRANTRELVAATCVVDSDYKNLFLPDKIWKINPNIKVANSWFLHYLIRNESFRDKLRARATGTSGSMLNISQQKFLSTKCYLPPLELQNNFSDIVELIQPIRAKMLMQLMELENQFQALMQNFFSR